MNKLILLLLFLPILSWSEIYVKVGEPRVSDLNVLVLSNLNEDLLKQLHKNLKATLFLNPIDIKKLGYSMINSDSVKSLEGQFALTAIEFDGKVLFELVDARKMASLYKVERKGKVELKDINSVSGEIYKILTGDDYFFNRKLAFVKRTAGHKELFVGDWDGGQPLQKTELKNIIVSPEWIDQNNLVFSGVLDFKKKARGWYLVGFDLAKNKHSLIPTGAAGNSAPARIPNSSDFIARLNDGDSAGVFRLNQKGERIQKILSEENGLIWTEMAVSPDGKELAVISNRSGGSHIFVMNIDGSNIKRVTFAGVRNNTPMWSPSGEEIVFSSDRGNHFEIFRVKKNGESLVKVLELKKDNGRWATLENPSYTPAGNGLIFTSNKSGVSHIYLTDLNGSKVIQLTEGLQDHFQPRLSPF
jgi:TolB protein